MRGVLFYYQFHSFEVLDSFSSCNLLNIITSWEQKKRQVQHETCLMLTFLVRVVYF